MNQDSTNGAGLEARHRRRRCFHSDRVDFENQPAFIWRLGTPAPSPDELKKTISDRVFVFERQPYRSAEPDTNPIRLLPEFSRAKELIEKTIVAKGRVVIYGDFDCDGVASITLMRDLLLACGLPERRLRCVIPHRLIHSYGLHWDCLQPVEREMADVGEVLSLVIVVDCGSSHLEAIRRILSENISVLVIDHHQPAKAIETFRHPDFVHLNPKLAAEGAVLQNLCAAGLVYMTAVELARPHPAWDAERALILAGMATCADVVSLRGVNRWLLKESLRLANKPAVLKRIPGLFWMAKRPRASAGEPVISEDVYYTVDEHTYGFEWGPNINAVGRMAAAETALRLLQADQTHDKEDVMPLVKQCRQLNQWRRATNLAIENWALAEAEAKNRRSKPSVLMLHNATWHPGVIGIVAARVKEKFHRPVVVCTKCADGLWRGSGRSIKNSSKTPYPMGNKFHAAMEQKKILQGGGHDMAGGLKLARYQLKTFEKWLHNESGLRSADLIPKFECYASASVLSPPEWWDAFEKLRPFGSDNPCPPLLVLRAELKSIRTRTKLDREAYRLKKQQAGMDPLDGESVANEGRTDANVAASGTGAKSLLHRIYHAKPRPLVWAYEGTFLDLDTGKIFFAHWMDLDQAEKMWTIKKYMLARNPSQWSFRWPTHFKLELQLQSYISASHWAMLEEGKTPLWECNFRILQCLPVSKRSRSATVVQPELFKD